MAIETECMTPGAVYTTHIMGDCVSIAVDYQRPIELSEAEAIQLEGNVHNALELALAPIFKEG